jgi:hypothetical protein
MTTMSNTTPPMTPPATAATGNTGDVVFADSVDTIAAPVIDSTDAVWLAHEHDDGQAATSCANGVTRTTSVIH